jgi:hypothetical protein
MRPTPAPHIDEDAATILNTRIGSSEAPQTGAFQAELHRYELGEKLGAGGMAAVFRAKDRITGQTVALKIIENGDDDPSRQARFEREVRAAGNLIHENVCRVLAFGRGPAQLFMAMELVEGSTMQRMIKARGTVPVPVALEALRQLLLALECAHARGVVHRDLKPANVMITPAGVLKLLDFGIAKSQEDATVTATGLLIGTPAFMSPEQILGGDVDPRSDLFSAGVTFLVMLTGRTRFSGLDPASVMVKVTSEPVPSLLEECPSASTDVDRFLSRLCAQNVNDRFQSASEALDVLRQLPELPPPDEGPALLARYIQEPDVVANAVAKREATAQLARAEKLMKVGPAGAPAAALALYRAALLDPTSEIAHQRLTSLCASAQLTFEPVDDPKIGEALAAFEKTPNAPGVLKRLADLYRAKGHVLLAAAFLIRYLRVKPTDSHAAQQLQVLLDGPEHTTGTGERLRTRDIVSGIKTGGHVDPAAGRPHVGSGGFAVVPSSPQPSSSASASPPPAAPVAGLRPPTGMQSLTGSVQARPARPPSGPVGANGRVTGQNFADPAGATVVIAGAPSDRTGANIHPLVLVVGAVIVAGLALAFFGRFIRTTVDDMQLAVSDQQARIGQAEQGALDRQQKIYLDEAKGHLERGNFAAAAHQANMLLAMKPPAELALEGMWIRAQARLKLDDPRSARIDLEEYLKQSTLDAPHRAQAKQLVDQIYADQARAVDAPPPSSPPSNVAFPTSDDPRQDVPAGGAPVAPTPAGGGLY